MFDMHIAHVLMPYEGIRTNEGHLHFRAHRLPVEPRARLLQPT